MDDIRGPGPVAYPVFHVSVGVLCCAFVSIPAMLTSVFFNVWVGIAAWVAGAGYVCYQVWRKLKREEITFGEYLVRRPAHLKGVNPGPPMLVGLVFVIFSVIVFCTDINSPTVKPENRPTLAQQLAMGSIFAMLGGGVFGLGFASLMTAMTKHRSLATFTERIEAIPDSPDAYIERGKILLDDSQAEAAVADFSEAIRLAPNKAEAFRERARAYYWLDETQKALADVERAMTLEPYNSELCIIRAMIHEDNEQQALADADFTKAEELDEEAGKV